MDRELEEKKAAYDKAIDAIDWDVLREEREAVMAYVAALEQYEAKYHILRRSIDELTRQLLSGHLLGPRLVERRGDRHGQGRGPAGRDFPLGWVKELDDPGELGGPKRAEVEVQTERPLARDAVELVEVGRGGGVEELAEGHESSTESETPSE